jgi:hypothetical protein
MLQAAALDCQFLDLVSFSDDGFVPPKVSSQCPLSLARQSDHMAAKKARFRPKVQLRQRKLLCCTA